MPDFSRRKKFLHSFHESEKTWFHHPMKIFAILRGNGELWNLCKSLKCKMNKLQKLNLNKVRLKIGKKILLLITEQKSIQAFFIYLSQMHNPYNRSNYNERWHSRRNCFLFVFWGKNVEPYKWALSIRKVSFVELTHGRI